MKELDETDAAFDQAPGQDAVGGVTARASGIGAVEFEGAFRFGGEVRELGDRRLHAERHFILADPGLDFRVTGLGEMLLVEIGEGVEHGPAERARKALGILKVENRFLGVAEFDALEAGRQEAVAPVVVVEGLIAGTLHFGDEHQIIGQVAVDRAESVAGPGTDAGPARDLASGEKERHGWGMVDLLGVKRFDDTDVIDHRSEVGEPVPEAGA